MRVYQREGSSKYWFRFTHSGTRYQKPTHLENRKHAEDYASAYYTRIVKGEVGLVPKDRQTVGECLDRLLADWRLNGKASMQNVSVLEKTRKAFTGPANEVT